ncbi:DsrE family protein [Thiohalobacter sp. IOR34]|uniref:DsrE family protein n=1 Tax=Thiohalobacter sp. IOR34 TaxID=3057176 RepID=UPI0025AF9A26|nr:DsrE family protein [Thiohalobacter sp. IOR34]WJW76009.1 DsrE family protein [Thiohalobacter sp. IOR34]
MANEPRKVMITVRRAPHGSIYVQEAIEVMFIVASYGMELSVVFLDDGVLALKRGQDTAELGIKGFMASIGALVDFEVEKVYVDRQSLAARNMSEEELVSIGEDEETEAPIRPQVLDGDEIRKMMNEQHSIMSF